MIDIHCHILPNLDDGAQSNEDVLEMGRAAVREGITTIVATPHHKNGSFENRKLDIINDVIGVNKLLKENNVPLTVLPGQETRLYGEFLEDYHKGEILPLANSRYVFVEFPSGYVPRYAKKLLYNIQLNNLIPIIVHPERNQQLLEEPDLIYDLVNNGSLTQITASSITGKFGKKIKRFSEQMIEANLTHFIASDAHNTTTRSFHLREAYETIKNEFHESYVYFYMENAELLIEDKHVMVDQPQQIKQRKKLFGLF